MLFQMYEAISLNYSQVNKCEKMGNVRANSYKLISFADDRPW